MNHIRPYKLFALVEASPAERVIQLQLPHRRGGGGTTLLETTALIAASNAVAAKRIFEFGTFLGSTTLNLALSIPEDGEVFTLDLDESSLSSVQQDPADAPLTELHMATRILDFMGSVVGHKVKTLTGNSITFDFAPWQDSIDLSFIDGGHDSVTVKADTEHALEIARKDRSAGILWHDYRNAEYPDLTRYLDGLSETLPIFHIEDTYLCVWFNSAALYERLF
jgi:hypothetical protein